MKLNFIFIIANLPRPAVTGITLLCASTPPPAAYLEKRGRGEHKGRNLRIIANAMQWSPSLLDKRLR